VPVDGNGADLTDDQEFVLAIKAGRKMGERFLIRTKNISMLKFLANFCYKDIIDYVAKQLNEKNMMF